MRARMSAKLMPAARTRTRISPSPGTGSDVSRTSNTSAPPCRGMTIWRISAGAYHAAGIGRFPNRWAVLEPPLRGQESEQRLLGMQPVFRLVEDDRRGGVHDVA